MTENMVAQVKWQSIRYSSSSKACDFLEMAQGIVLYCGKTTLILTNAKQHLHEDSPL